MLSILLVFSSCGLLPEEETFRTVPVITTYEKEEFEETVVVRGDMQLTNQISCTYIPLKTEDLSFSVGGELYDKIFVEVGDRVEKGQLLAQLDLSGAEEDIANSSEQINRLKMQMDALEENRELELQRQKILLGDVYITFIIQRKIKYNHFRVPILEFHFHCQCIRDFRKLHLRVFRYFFSYFRRQPPSYAKPVLLSLLW